MIRATTVAIITITTLTFSAVRVPATVLISSVTPGSFTGFNDAEIGYQIRPNSDIFVTGLSLYDVNQDGLGGDYTVTLWSNSGSSLVTTVIKSGTTSPIDAAGFRTESLETVIKLNAGTVYMLSASFGDVMSSPEFLFDPSIAVTPDITILNTSNSPAILAPLTDTTFQGSNGSFPDQATTGEFLGPSLTFSVIPEPSTFVLATLALLSLGMIGRRRRRR